MTDHRRDSATFTRQDGRTIIDSGCLGCGIRYRFKGASVRQAAWRAIRAEDDHRGFAYAAGPGTEMAA